MKRATQKDVLEAAKVLSGGEVKFFAAYHLQKLLFPHEMGYCASKRGISSAIQALKKKGLIKRVGYGWYAIVQEPPK